MEKFSFEPVEGGISLGANADSGIGRGNLEGTGDGGNPGILDPASLGNADTGSIDGRKQRKKRGPNKAKTVKQNGTLDLGTIKNSLIIAHFGLAGAFAAPELALTEDQATAYAVAASDVMSYYDMGATAKTIAWVNLMAAMGGIYWQKFAEINARKSAEKAARVQASQSSATVMSFNPRL